MARKTKINWKRVVLCVFCAYVAVRLICGFGEIYELKQQKAQLDAHIEEAMLVQNDLKQQVEMMSQPEEMERVAREQLGYVLPGEVVLKKIEDSNSSNE